MVWRWRSLEVAKGEGTMYSPRLERAALRIWRGDRLEFDRSPRRRGRGDGGSGQIRQRNPLTLFETTDHLDDRIVRLAQLNRSGFCPQGADHVRHRDTVPHEN